MTPVRRANEGHRVPRSYESPHGPFWRTGERKNRLFALRTNRKSFWTGPKGATPKRLMQVEPSPIGVKGRLDPPPPSPPGGARCGRSTPSTAGHRPAGTPAGASLWPTGGRRARLPASPTAGGPGRQTRKNAKSQHKFGSESESESASKFLKQIFSHCKQPQPQKQVYQI